MKEIKIKNRTIGKTSPCFIIAEAGVNHNGSMELAKKLIDFAKETGTDAVKFQAYKTESIVTETAEIAEYQERNTEKKETQAIMLKRLEFNEKDFIELKNYCDKKKIMFLCTPHTEDTVDFLDSLVPAFKIASGDLTNLPLLEKIARKQKPIIMGTGMANMEEIGRAVKTIQEQENEQIILLHCTTNYPCPMEEVNLKAMQSIDNDFECVIGYSDHTSGIIVPVMAVAMGAKVIEKHFTLDKNLEGPDHKASLEPDELKEMVGVIRNAEIVLGDGIKKATENEEKIKVVGRKSVVARIDIPEGIIIKREMLVIKRPGNGIASKDLDIIVGKTAKKDIKKDALLKFEDLS